VWAGSDRLKTAQDIGVGIGIGVAIAIQSCILSEDPNADCDIDPDSFGMPNEWSQCFPN
jgi:hypothetical protein